MLRRVSLLATIVVLCAATDMIAADAVLVQQPLYVAGQDGYHTYRIPALIVAPDGAILAFCEGRKKSRSDHGDIDMVMKRSTDYGKTWSKMQILIDGGEHTMGNPCPVVDRETGVVWLPYCRDNDTVHVISSPDNGKSWSAPVDITRQIKSPKWGWYATGPTHGIQTAGGRLVIPCDHKINGSMYYSHVFFSDDHGKSWQLGGSLPVKTDECGVVELADGSLLINMRS